MEDVSYNEKLFTPFHHGIDPCQNIYYTGFFQDPIYTNCIYDQLTHDFRLRLPIVDLASLDLLDKIRSSNSVMINVRRTDYVGSSVHGTLGMDYYHKAISIVEEKINNPKYFIFSDDIKWCRENFQYLKNSFIVDHSYKGDRFGEYLELMKNCMHFIIPNSSFAWWSAYLAPNKNKVVVAPKFWFKANIKTNIVSEDLNWIKIQTKIL